MNWVQVSYKCQGSILGPLLFLIFINNLPLYIQNNSSTIDLYTDDTTIYYSNHDKLKLERNLQKSLDCLQMWCRIKGIILNINNVKKVRSAVHHRISNHSKKK